MLPFNDSGFVLYGVVIRSCGCGGRGGVERDTGSSLVARCPGYRAFASSFIVAVTVHSAKHYIRSRCPQSLKTQAFS